MQEFIYFFENISSLQRSLILVGGITFFWSIESLIPLFKFNYSSGKKNTRLPLLFNAIGYLTHYINYNIPVRNDYKIFIQVQGNLNKMFLSKKYLK